MTQTISTNKSRACILDYPVDIVTLQDAIDLAENYIKSDTGAHVITINPEMIMYSLKNPDFGEILRNADLIIPDGVGIKVALKKLGMNVSQVPGIEFSEELIKKCVSNNFSIALLGSTEEVVNGVIKELKNKYPEINIVFSHDGYFNEEKEHEIIDKLASLNPKVLFVALGVPRQELWINKYKKTLHSTIMVGVGGSFDVWAKKVKRAPVLFRKFGLEWFFRLISQPSRFRRMFPTLPLFFIKVMLDTKTTRKEY